MLQSQTSMCEKGSDGAADSKKREDYSFEELVVPLRREMLNFAKKLTCSNDSRAEDIVQDSILRAFKAWGRFTCDPDEDVEHVVRAWVYKIVANTFKTHYHHGKIRSRAGDNRHDDIVIGIYGRDHIDPREDLGSPFSDEVLAALTALSPNHREIVLLYYLRDLTCDEIAEHLNISRNTVFTRLMRARKAITPLLKKYAKDAYGLNEALTFAANKNGTSHTRRARIPVIKNEEDEASLSGKSHTRRARIPVIKNEDSEENEENEENEASLSGPGETLTESTESPETDTDGVDSIVAGDDDGDLGETETAANYATAC